MDVRTGDIINKGKRKDIKKFVREETKLLVYAAKTERGFRGKYKIEIGFSDGKKKTLRTDV